MAKQAKPKPGQAGKPAPGNVRAPKPGSTGKPTRVPVKK